MNSIIYCIIFILSTFGLIDVVYRLGQNRKEEELLKGLEIILNRYESALSEDEGFAGDMFDEVLDLFGYEEKENECSGDE